MSKWADQGKPQTGHLTPEHAAERAWLAASLLAEQRVIAGAGATVQLVTCGYTPQGQPGHPWRDGPCGMPLTLRAGAWHHEYAPLDTWHEAIGPAACSECGRPLVVSATRGTAGMPAWEAAGGSECPAGLHLPDDACWCQWNQREQRWEQCPPCADVRRRASHERAESDRQYRAALDLGRLLDASGGELYPDAES